MSKQKKGRIGILIGNKIAPNMEAFLYNVGKMLSDHFKLDILGSFELPSRLKQYYEIYYITQQISNSSTKGYFLRFLTYLKDCLNYIDDKSPDILFQVTHYSIHSPIISIAGKLKGIPVVLRLAGDDFNEYKFEQTFFKKLKHYVRCNIIGKYPLHLADKIIVLNTYGKEQLIKHGCRSDKIEVIPQPIDTERFTKPRNKTLIREELCLPLDKKIVLYVGRLSRLKGMETFLNAIPNVTKRRKDILFLFVGKGEYSEKLRQLKNVYIVNEVPHSQIHRYYQASDLLVHPSLIEVGITNTMLEAIACGVPVIARNLPGIKEFGITTFKSDFELIELLLKNNWKSIQLPPEFDWEYLKRKYLKLFLTLLEKNK